VKIHKSPFRIVWLLMSFMILLFVGAAGAAAFYWVLQHRDNFSLFGLTPPNARVSVPVAAAQPVNGETAPTAAANETAAELPAPVALEAVKRPAATPSLAYLPPPPVPAAAVAQPVAAQSVQTQAGAAQLASSLAGPAAAAAVQVGASASPTPAPFALGTILCGDAHDCSAVVNGHTVHRGEVIRDFRVIEITTTQVRLQRGSEAPIVLSLFR
jgi:hypothetical protein